MYGGFCICSGTSFPSCVSMMATIEATLAVGQTFGLLWTQVLLLTGMPTMDLLDIPVFSLTAAVTMRFCLASALQTPEQDRPSS